MSSKKKIVWFAEQLELAAAREGKTVPKNVSLSGPPEPESATSASEEKTSSRVILSSEFGTEDEKWVAEKRKEVTEQWERMLKSRTAEARIKQQLKAQDKLLKQRQLPSLSLDHIQSVLQAHGLSAAASSSSSSTSAGIADAPSSSPLASDEATNSFTDDDDSSEGGDE